MRVALAACTLALCASSVSAQRPELERVDSLIAAGETTRAASLLKQWQQANSADNNAHALYLAAQLESDADLARDLYVSIALSHPTSRYAPTALLRLGQLSQTAGEWQRAIGYLDRLLVDYPAAQERESGYLWLLRAHMSGGRSSDACALAGVALRGEVRDPALNEQVRAEERRACGAVAASPAAGTPNPAASPAAGNATPAASPATGNRNAAASPAASDTKASTPPRSESQSTSGNTRTGASNPARANASFAVQAGAFKEVRGANTVANGLKQAGFDARVTQVEGTSLNHVRVGFFASRADAAAMVQRMKDKGFNAMIVDDVRREK